MSIKGKFKIVFTLLIGIMFSMMGKYSYATHYSGADITYTCLGNNKYVIEFRVNIDCFELNNESTSTVISLKNNCGADFTFTLPLIYDPVTGNKWTDVSQLCSEDSLLSTCISGALPGMSEYVYRDTITLTPCDSWTISWRGANRNATANVDSYVMSFYVETTLNNVINDCNNSPKFTAIPIPYVCAFEPVSYDLGVEEEDGDSLSFSFIGVRGDASQFLTYYAPYSANDAITGITIDPATGIMNFTPTAIGNFLVSIGEPFSQVT